MSAIESAERKLGIDFIGDVHGRRAELEELLGSMGYACSDGAWRAPAGRKAVFVGDLVDRGDDVPGVLGLVKAMAGVGEATVLLGNHEFNILCYYTRDGNGGYLRARTPEKSKSLAKTRAYFDADPEAKREYLAWFRSLPVRLDVPGARGIHAYWGRQELDRLGTGNTLDQLGWGDVRFRETAHGKALERLIKGPEVPLPGAQKVADRHGIKRNRMRLAWWRNEENPTYADMAARPHPDLPDVPMEAGQWKRFGPYPAEEPLVVIGHYGFAAYPGPLADNVACVDYPSCSGIGAYRWSGEGRVRAEHFVR